MFTRESTLNINVHERKIHFDIIIFVSLTIIFFLFSITLLFAVTGSNQQIRDLFADTSLTVESDRSHTIYEAVCVCVCARLCCCSLLEFHWPQTSSSIRWDMMVYTSMNTPVHLHTVRSYKILMIYHFRLFIECAMLSNNAIPNWL